MISRRTSSIPKEEEVVSQTALLWFEAPEGHYISPVNLDTSPVRREACNSPSECMWFRHSRQSCPEHPGVSDGN